MIGTRYTNFIYNDVMDFYSNSYKRNDSSSIKFLYSGVTIIIVFIYFFNKKKI